MGTARTDGGRDDVGASAGVIDAAALKRDGPSYPRRRRIRGRLERDGFGSGSSVSGGRFHGLLFLLSWSAVMIVSASLSSACSVAAQAAFVRCSGSGRSVSSLVGLVGSRSMRRKTNTGLHDRDSGSAGSSAWRVCDDPDKAEELGDDPDALPEDAKLPREQLEQVELFSVDVRHGFRAALTYDPSTGRYLGTSDRDQYHQRDRTQPKSARIKEDVLRRLHSAFVPEGVNPSYYRFMRWRILQRFANANVHVIGTQSLLLGLKGGRMGGGALGGAGTAAATASGALALGAATNWVLKDCLGKIVRMVWASKMGRKFDPDAKRWRFRSSLIYAVGNGLEVSTYIFPKYFLLLATLANSCKQMSMLTSSATRNALYSSFQQQEGNHQSSRENIGDITAKGEAQIAVVDLMGIFSGICLSRAVGVSTRSVVSVWIALQLAEIFCMHREMRAVVYRTFNFERMYLVLGGLLAEDKVERANDDIVDDDAGGNDDDDDGICDMTKAAGTIVVAGGGGDCARAPSPEEVARRENIFYPPDHLARRAIAFGSPGRTELDPSELSDLLDVFRGEKYFLVAGQDVKNARGLSSRFRQWRRRRRLGMTGVDPQEQCHIVLHADANNLDILKSALALSILRGKLVDLYDGRTTAAAEGGEGEDNDESVEPSPLRTRDCMSAISESRAETDVVFPRLLRELTKRGWQPPLRSMLGRVSIRAEWPIRGGGGGRRARSSASSSSSPRRRSGTATAPGDVDVANGDGGGGNVGKADVDDGAGAAIEDRTKR